MIDEARSTTEPARWKVLLVDDEPEVHDVSRLILAGLSFEGRDIELLSACSAAQAREILAQQDDIALALLDVVMETDDAGLALVQHVRERLADRDMQIVLRTGQPGMAPERDVVKRYEINGYYLKTEITAQRLHSIVISGLRSYRHARSLRAVPAQRMQPDPSAGAHAVDRVLAAELEQAAQPVSMQAQPEVLLASNQVCGIELVPQWKTSLGLLPASRVCEALPPGPLRQRVARWMLGHACHWARSWHTSAGAAVRVSIPLVGELLSEPEVPDAITTMVRSANLPAGTLDLLVGEAMLLSGHPNVRTAVDIVRRSGVTITLVDFGARTISLPSLGQVVPDRLKIHRVFVRGVTGDPERMAIARSLIALAQTLNIAAIADGIASDGDAQFFKWEGCELGQGDALAPACAPTDVADMLLHGRQAAH